MAEETDAGEADSTTKIASVFGLWSARFKYASCDCFSFFGKLFLVVREKCF